MYPWWAKLEPNHTDITRHVLHLKCGTWLTWILLWSLPHCCYVYQDATSKQDVCNWTLFHLGLLLKSCNRIIIGDKTYRNHCVYSVTKQNIFIFLHGFKLKSLLPNNVLILALSEPFLEFFLFFFFAFCDILGIKVFRNNKDKFYWGNDELVLSSTVQAVLFQVQ